MAKLSYKVSYYVLYALFAVIAVVLGLYFGVGYNTVNAAGLVEPQYTEAILYLKYILVAVTIVLALGAGLIQFCASLKDDPKGAIKTVIALILVVALVVVCYGMGSTEPIIANGVPYTDEMWLKVTDMFIYSMYALGVIATIATIINMSGIFKKNKF